MKNISRSRFLGLCIVFISFIVQGCCYVSSKQPVGQPLDSDLSEQCDGAWLTDEGEVCYMKYVQNGQLHLAGVEWHEEKFNFEEETLLLTACGERIFVNYSTEDKKKETQEYIFLGCSFSEKDKITGWEPRIETFVEAVEQGELKGKIINSSSKAKDTLQEKSRRSVILDEDSRVLCDFISTKSDSELFYLDKPIVYNRIKIFERGISSGEGEDAGEE